MSRVPSLADIAFPKSAEIPLAELQEDVISRVVTGNKQKVRDIFARMRRNIDASHAVAAAQTGDSQPAEAVATMLEQWQEDERAVLASFDSREFTDRVAACVANYYDIRTPEPGNRPLYRSAQSMDALVERWTIPDILPESIFSEADLKKASRRRLIALARELPYWADLTALDHRPDSPSGKRISTAEANLRAREALKNPKLRSVRKLAKAIGCSAGRIPKLPAWRAYQEELNKPKLPTAPRAVSLTDGVLANEGRDDEALEKLIHEQQADYEESPLVSNARKQPRRRRKL